jgi:hypothetical protein
MSHVRHHGARHPDDPEEVRIEDRPGLADRALFRSSWGDAEAGVVHEQVDAAIQPHHFPDGGPDGFIPGHVEGQHLERSLACLGSPSAGSVDLVACPGKTLCCRFADA